MVWNNFQSLYRPSPYLDYFGENLDPPDFGHKDEIVKVEGTGPSNTIKMTLQTKHDRLETIVTTYKGSRNNLLISRSVFLPKKYQESQLLSLAINDQHTPFNSFWNAIKGTVWPPMDGRTVTVHYSFTLKWPSTALRRHVMSCQPI